MLSNKALQGTVLDTVGIHGLDTQTTATALSAEWLTKADNLVYTEGGKITFRKGVKQRTTEQGNSIGAIVEHRLSGKIFASYNGTIAEVNLADKDNAFINTFSTGATHSDWQFVEFKDELYCFQEDSAPVEYDGGDWEILEDYVDETVDAIKAGVFIIGARYKISDVGNTDFTLIGAASNTVGIMFTATGIGSGSGEAHQGSFFPEGITEFDPTCGLGYYGRMWVGGIQEDKNVLYYSELEDAHSWAPQGDAGFVDLKYVWGSDEIVAIHAYSGKLVIFGKQNIAIYNNPWEVATGGMYLDEVVQGVGCVSRDSIQEVGNDLYFVSDTGVRSLMRTATANQDKLPLREISVTVKDEIISNIHNSKNIKSAYVLDEGLYIVTFPDLNVTYVFDITYNTPKNTPRVTKWNFEGSREPVSLAYSAGYGLLFGQAKGSVCSYEGYYDIDYEGSEEYTYFPFTGGFSTVWLDLGEGYISAILKKLLMVVSGGQGTDVGVRLYKDFELVASTSSTFKINPTLSGVPYYWNQTAKFGTAKYAPIHGLKEIGLPLAGDAKYVRFEMDGVTNGFKTSLQSLSLLYKPGKIY